MNALTRIVFGTVATAALLFSTAGCVNENTDYSSKAATVGIRAETAGRIVYWLIPLTETFESDRKALFDLTLENFVDSMKTVRADFEARGIDTSKFLPGTPDDVEFKKATQKVIESLARSATEDTVSDQLNKNPEYGDVKKLSSWKKYTIPQAFFTYFGADFSLHVGLGAGGSATVFIVTQPWLKIGIDSRTGKQVSKSLMVQKAVLGVPNLLIGAGAGGGGKVNAGAGIVFGPLNQPNDMAGFGLGINAAGSFGPVGVSGKIITVLRNPPLIYVMAGYAGGISGGIEIQGNGQALMPLEKFLDTFLKFAK